ncbi:MAG: hypothetical protein EU532_13510 [Promethearchaeota archaeon]|nr:MAG: hypothetical protein EU532_13510 [Candidatus Lokiarchaeota archaeon]
MAEFNIKSLVFGIIFGFLSWLWAFILVGAAFYDWVANKPIENPNFGVYVTLLIVTFIVSIIIIGVYLWKVEQKNPIVANKWAIDAVILGIIICKMNFLLDALFFGMLGRNLIAYFFLETTTGYLYPLIILETFILAYLIYGKNK